MDPAWYYGAKLLDQTVQYIYFKVLMMQYLLVE